MTMTEGTSEERRRALAGRVGRAKAELVTSMFEEHRAVDDYVREDQAETRPSGLLEAVVAAHRRADAAQAEWGAAAEAQLAHCADL